MVKKMNNDGVSLGEIENKMWRGLEKKLSSSQKGLLL